MKSRFIGTATQGSQQGQYPPLLWITWAATVGLGVFVGWSANNWKESGLKLSYTTELGKTASIRVIAC